MLRGIEVVPLAQQIAHTEIVGGVANQLLTPPSPDDERAASSKVVTACWSRPCSTCNWAKLMTLLRMVNGLPVPRTVAIASATRRSVVGVTSPLTWYA